MIDSTFATLSASMGRFRIDVAIGNPSGIGARQTIRNVLVDNEHSVKRLAEVRAV